MHGLLSLLISAVLFLGTFAAAFVVVAALLAIVA
jgi:hypothetical protein